MTATGSSRLVKSEKRAPDPPYNHGLHKRSVAEIVAPAREGCSVNVVEGTLKHRATSGPPHSSVTPAESRGPGACGKLLIVWPSGWPAFAGMTAAGRELLSLGRRKSGLYGLHDFPSAPTSVRRQHDAQALDRIVHVVGEVDVLLDRLQQEAAARARRARRGRARRPCRMSSSGFASVPSAARSAWWSRIWLVLVWVLMSADLHLARRLGHDDARPSPSGRSRPSRRTPSRSSSGPSPPRTSRPSRPRRRPAAGRNCTCPAASRRSAARRCAWTLHRLGRVIWHITST